METIEIHSKSAQFASVSTAPHWIGPYLHPKLLGFGLKTGQIHVLQELVLLNALTKDHDLTAAIAAFMSDSEIIQILGAWAPTNPVAKQLEVFARTLWSEVGLGQSLRPFQSDQLVSRKLRGSLTDHYLSAMCASRRPITDQVTARFVQRLRTLALVRSAELIQQGFVRESKLAIACSEIRKACESSNDWRLSLLNEIAIDESDLVDFCASLHSRCENRILACQDRDRRFLNALIALANSGPWRPEMLISDLKHPRGGLHSFELPVTTHRSEPAHETSDIGDSEEADFIFDESGSVLTIAQIVPEKGVAPKEVATRGNGLILSALEEVQYLRHSWHSLTLSEEGQFATHCETMLQKGSESEAAGCAFILVAFATQRGLVGVESIAIQSAVSTDWSVHRKTAEISRTPPRFTRGWSTSRESGDFERWLHPLSDRWTVSLHPRAQASLKNLLKKHRRCKTLGQLWAAAFPHTTLNEWFGGNFQTNTGLSRISPSSVGNLLRLNAYEYTQNQSFARLLGSQPRTGLPAACAYGAFRSPLVLASLETFPRLLSVVKPTQQDDLNECGSELDVRPEKIRDAITDLLHRTNDASQWVERHNLLTCFTVLALYASTGARPVNSPFESLLQFDLNAGLIFVQDKVSGPTKSARICVLVESVVTLLRDVYLPHLNALAAALEKRAPSFATQIRTAVLGSNEPGLPLFFFLRDEPNLDWLEVTETQLGLEGKLNWPLPWNLFRHLHATQLPRMGLSAEIVDALLSHGDRGAESHGDLSLRIPQEDLEHARGFVEGLFSVLGFTTPNPSTLPEYLEVIPGRSTIATNDRQYGSAARERARLKSLESAKRLAKQEVVLAVGKRPIDSLSAGDWQKIGRSMIFRMDGVPHSNASLRYKVFEDYLENAWQSKRVLPQLRRAYRVLPAPSALFTQDFIGAKEKLQASMAAFEKTVAELPASPLSAISAATLAAFDLVFYSQVAHWRVLDAVVRQLPVIRVIKFQFKYWLEWSDANEWRDGKPMFRVGITPRCAQWITWSQESRRTLSEVPPTPKPLTNFVPDSSERSALKRHIQQLVALQDQRNCWDLAGTDAAYLSGRQLFPALPHADWYRVMKPGRALKPRDPQIALGEVDLAPYLSDTHHKSSAQRDETPTLVECAAFFESLRKAMLEGEKDANSRATDVKRLLANSGYSHGDLPYVFGHYGLHLLKRERRRGLGNELRTSTIKRYLASLLGPICDLGFNKSFSTLDEDDLTELYCDMLDWWGERNESDTDTDEEVSEKNGRLAASESAADGARRCLVQLKEFHDFAERSYAAQTPDWSQISTEQVGAIGRPGYILDSEYRVALLTILSSRLAKDLPDDDLGECLTLLLCKRFGLRVGEAIGATMEDWIDHEGAIVLLVQPNRIRPLKTESSRRQVPLIGRLDEMEQTIIAESLLRASRGAANIKPLVPAVTKTTFDARKDTIGKAVRELLKEVTSNPDCVLHFTRHAFATDVLTLLRGTITAPSPIPGAHTHHVRKLLLAYDGIDRRALWGVCRLLGHKSPGVTARCYLHGIEQWCPTAPPMGPWDGHGPGRAHLVDLDECALDDRYGIVRARAQAELKSPLSKLAQAFTYLRLRAQGLATQQALIAAEMSNDDWMLLSKSLERVGFVIGGAQPKESSAAEPSELGTGTSQENILELLPLSRWVALSAVTEAASDPVSGDLLDWHETVGKRRQIVLFNKAHAQSFLSFCTALKLDPNDLSIVITPNANNEFMGWFDCLKNFQIGRDLLGPTFQFDTATTGSQKFVVRTRAVAIPKSPPDRLHIRIELLLLWITWCIVGTTARK